MQNQTTISKPTRESGYELLRILSMIMIIAFHTFRYIPTSSFSPWEMLFFHSVRWYGLLGVNCFLMISAWFMIGKPIKTQKLFDLVIQTAFYCVLLFLCHIIHQLSLGEFRPVKDIWEIELNALMSPFWTNRYWFITSYIFLYLMMPLLNRWILSLSKDAYRKWILGLSLFLFCYLTFPQTFSNTTVIGDFIWVCFCYFLTGYLKLHSPELPLKSHPGICFILTYAVFLLSKQLLSEVISNDYLEYLVAHTTGNSMRYSFIMLLMAVELFYLFQKIHFKNAFINAIATTMFGVYLFHENKVFHLCELLAKKLYTPCTSQICLPLFMILLVVVQLLGGCIIDLIRQHTLESLLHTHLSSKWKARFQKWDKFLNS